MQKHHMLLLAGIVAVGSIGCRDLTGSQQLPSGTVNPSTYNTPAGAIGMRAAAINDLETEIPNFVVNTGLLTDELQSSQIGASVGVLFATPLPPGGILDARILPSESYGEFGTAADNDYQSLHRIRGDLNQALGAIAAFDTGVGVIGHPRIMRGELYALQGYVEILLADFFCSGIPLSTLDFQQDFTYHASSKTTEVYQDAITKLDSAMVLSDTSEQVLNLARVLKGRALLALDSVAAASQAVSEVPGDFQYRLAIQWTAAMFGNITPVNTLNSSATVSDREGVHGLPYISSQDPRTEVVNSIINDNGVQLTFPMRYQQTDFSPFVVADGIEARLIGAEAAYRVNHDTATMISILNQLRSTAQVSGQTGTLPMLTDPGNDSASVALLFQERAYWLFLTGHRQGDLRRLLRQYGQWFHNLDHVYPTGVYLAPGTKTYGTDATAPIPGNEYLNSLFHGCINRDP